MGIKVVGQGQGPPGADHPESCEREPGPARVTATTGEGSGDQNLFWGEGGGVVEFGTDPPKDC